MDTSRIEARKQEHLQTAGNLKAAILERQEAIGRFNNEINQLQANFNAVQGQLSELEFWLVLADADKKTNLSVVPPQEDQAPEDVLPEHEDLG